MVSLGASPLLIEEIRRDHAFRHVIRGRLSMSGLFYHCAYFPHTCRQYTYYLY